MARLRSRSRGSRSHAMHDISLTPIIDVALTLLVIFIMTAPAIQNAIKVNLPRGEVKEDEGLSENIIVYIDKDSKLYLNGTCMEVQDLYAALKERAKDSHDETVYVKGDIGAEYGKVIELVDTIKHIDGVSYVALATQKRTS